MLMDLGKVSPFLSNYEFISIWGTPFSIYELLLLHVTLARVRLRTRNVN